MTDHEQGAAPLVDTHRATHETAIAAVEAEARASIQAALFVAERRPRDLDIVRDDILGECARPRFAEVARYSIPRGGGRIEGWTIRFAEAVIRAMRNVVVDSRVLYDDDNERLCAVRVWDIESGASYGRQIMVPKTIERRHLPDGVVPISSRVNSTGQTVYLLPSTDDDLQMRQGAAISKAIRTEGLRIVPGWLLDECADAVEATRRGTITADPDGERRKIIDAFKGQGVKATQLKQYIGHDMATLTLDEIVELRDLYQAIADGVMSFATALREKTQTRTTTNGGEGETRPSTPSPADTAALDAIRAAGGTEHV